MRDDQILLLIQKECQHLDTVSLLRTQQLKIRINSMESAMSEKWVLFKALFNPSSFWQKVEEIYKVKAQAYNEELKEKMTRDKLRI